MDATKEPWRPIGLPAPGEQFGADPNARTQTLTHEVAIVETVPPDAVQMGLTDLTAPGLAMVNNLNPDNPGQMRKLKWMATFMVAPVALVALGIIFGQ